MTKHFYNSFSARVQYTEVSCFAAGVSMIMEQAGSGVNSVQRYQSIVLLMSEITIYYLEMLNVDSHHHKPLPVDLSVSEACVKQYQVNRMLYQLVGEAWDWNDKSNWSQDKWRNYAESDDLRTWLAYSNGSIAGYFELKQIDTSTNELAYFGLAPKFIGRGFGGALLSVVITEAWRWGKPARVIVNTCSLDHPNALANYKARGFTLYETKTIPA